MFNSISEFETNFIIVAHSRHYCWAEYVPHQFSALLYWRNKYRNVNSQVSKCLKNILPNLFVISSPNSWLAHMPPLMTLKLLFPRGILTFFLAYSCEGYGFSLQNQVINQAVTKWHFYFWDVSILYMCSRCNTLRRFAGAMPHLRKLSVRF